MKNSSNNYVFTQDWFSQDIPNIKKVLARFKAKPVQMIEIGSFEGRSTVWFIDNILTHKDAKITCIDFFMGSPEHQMTGVNTDNIEKTFELNILKSSEPRKVKKVKGISQEILRQLPLHSYDIIYIDGSHKASDVLEDAVLSFRLLKKNGVMMFDDYIWPINLPEIEKPKLGIDAFLQTFEGQYELLHKEGQVFLRKK